MLRLGRVGAGTESLSRTVKGAGRPARSVEKGTRCRSYLRELLDGLLLLEELLPLDELLLDERGGDDERVEEREPDERLADARGEDERDGEERLTDGRELEERLLEEEETAGDRLPLEEPPDELAEGLDLVLEDVPLSCRLGLDGKVRGMITGRGELLLPLRNDGLLVGDWLERTGTRVRVGLSPEIDRLVTVDGRVTRPAVSGYE